MKSLREYIRFLLESGVLGEPDMSAEDEREDGEEDEQAGGVPGVQVPLGTGPSGKRKKRRQDAEKANASAFGGAKEIKK